MTPRSRRKRKGAAAGAFALLRRCLLYGAGLFLLGTTLLILLLRWVPPPTSMFMILHELAGTGKGGTPVRYHWIPMEEIPPHMALAAVAAEDQKFPHHWGFDVQAMVDAARSNVRGGAMRGGSTISQQVAKNLFLWSDRSYLRKGLEAGLTILLEALWPKERILEVYLNIAEFGPGIYGVHAAAAHYFRCAPQQLTRRQAALLAASLPAPSRFHPDRPEAKLDRRAHWVLEQMANLGSAYLSAGDA